MKPKHMFYAALGYTTFKAGKLFAKRSVRTAARDWYGGRRRRIAGRQT
jgi:hypothetical protein